MGCAIQHPHPGILQVLGQPAGFNQKLGTNKTLCHVFVDCGPSKTEGYQKNPDLRWNKSECDWPSQ